MKYMKLMECCVKKERIDILWDELKGEKLNELKESKNRKTRFL